jgi:hypothetical protein
MDSQDRSEHARHSNPGKWVLVGFLAVAAYFLWTEHQAHLMGALPYLLLLACPLMHLFHHGHGGHGHHHGNHDHSRGHESSRTRNRTGKES